MKISYNWLKQYVNCDYTAEKVSELLTSTGLEVEDLERFESVKGALKGVVVGKVLTCIDHPNSDHLHITTVDVGGEEPLHIVCGAPNVAAGQKVLVATINTELWMGDEHITIKKGKIRGEVSVNQRELRVFVKGGNSVGDLFEFFIAVTLKRLFSLFVASDYLHPVKGAHGFATGDCGLWRLFAA